MSENEGRKTPARWRKPDRPVRMSAVDAFIWNRTTSKSRRLYRGDRHLASAYPDGRWFVYVGERPIRKEVDLESAKKEAKAAAIREELKD